MGYWCGIVSIKIQAVRDTQECVGRPQIWYGFSTPVEDKRALYPVIYYRALLEEYSGSKVMRVNWPTE